MSDLFVGNVVGRLTSGGTEIGVVACSRRGRGKSPVQCTL